MNSTIFTNLRSILAELYPDERSISRIIDDAGIELARVAFDAKAINIWHSVLSEAGKINKIDALLRVAEGEYDTNWKLSEVCAAYRRSIQVPVSSPNPPLNYSQTAGVRRPIPDHLPYMVNRHEQEDELALALKRLGRQTFLPVVCLAYGDEHQSHDMFVDRLKRVSLPTLLDLKPDQNTITGYQLTWPTFRNVQDLHEKLQNQLARIICRDTWMSNEEINRTLALHPNPVLIHLDLFDEEWQRHGLVAVTEFLHFWQRWPPLVSGQRLFVYLCIRHRTQPGTRHKQGIMDWLPWFKPPPQTDAVEVLMVQVRAKATSAEFSRLLCVPLTKLTGVERRHVHRWASSKETQMCCHRHIPEQEIRDLFDRWERQMASTAIPMEQIATELKKILMKYID